MNKTTKTLATVAGAAAVLGVAMGVRAALEAFADVGGENGDKLLAEARHYHLVPRDDGWALQRAGGDQALRRFDTKQTALDTSRTMMDEMKPTVLVVHRADGTIEAQHTYGVA
jgi:hypothetical protein